jgi:hypothetical protein
VTVRLDVVEMQAAYYAVAACIRERRLGGRAVPDEVYRLYQRLHTACLSRGRHENGSGAEDAQSSGVEKWIGSPEVAQLMGWSKRQVQRHAREMRGQIAGGRWLFRESDVIAYAEGRAADGTRPGG